MKINLQVEFSDKPGEPKEVTCLASDMVKFETHFNISIANLDKDLKITHLLFLAWASETRTKATAKTKAPAKVTAAAKEPENEDAPF
jgi:hypothetical protein